MGKKTSSIPRSFNYYLRIFLWTLVGCFLAALGIDAVLIPNQLIDGGVVGLSMIGAHLFGKQFFSPLLVLLTVPFFWLAYKHMGKAFLIHMFVAVVLFSGSAAFLNQFNIHFQLEPLEVIVLGGVLLGIGGGLVIRSGGCIDGTEIFAILINRKKGFTVGQVILSINIVIFSIAGLVFWDIHTAFLSMMTFIVATKMLDMVLVGLEETKSVMIIAKSPHKLAETLLHQLGVGCTYLYGRGGYSGNDRELLYIIVERLQLASLKELVYREDPTAFIAVQNLHEVINGRINTTPAKKSAH